MAPPTWRKTGAAPAPQVDLTPSYRAKLMNGACIVAVYAGMCPPDDARMNAARIATGRFMAALEAQPNG